LELELVALPLAFLFEVSEEDEELGSGMKVALGLELELFALPLAFLLEVLEEDEELGRELFDEELVFFSVLIRTILFSSS
jgi:hypothetical protein